MKRIVFVFLAIFHVVSLLSVPARPFPFTVVQADGSLLTVRMYGDEAFHYAATDDGIPMVMGAQGSYYYAEALGGRLTATAVLAHDAQHRNSEEKAFVDNHRISTARAIDECFAKAMSTRDRAYSSAPLRLAPMHRTACIGQRKGLVILVNFADLAMRNSTARTDFNRMFNERGYADNGHSGSVHDYFSDQSYGKLDIDFDVVGPFTVSKPYSYYGENDRNDSDSHPGEMVAEACRLADKTVNFADYDWDGDGTVEQVFIVYAGYAESSGAPSNTIWPHKFSLSGCYSSDDGDGSLTLDGVTVDTYACTSELEGIDGTEMRGIGTACHEFSHCLGLPDVYDVNYNGGVGMQQWDVMAAGSYNGPSRNGERPIGYTAYERWAMGWLELTELSSICRITGMPCLDDEPVAYAIYNDNNRDEMFVLENRQHGRWFSCIDSENASHGMLITHIDYSEAAWTRNRVNTVVNHQRYSFVPADNSYGKLLTSGEKKSYQLSDEELMGDLFPGSGGIAEFTDASHQTVGGRLFTPYADGSCALGKPITNIKECDGLVSFDFMGGVFVPIPYDVKVRQCADDSVAISWAMETVADSCIVEFDEVRLLPTFNVVLNENFSKFKSSEDSADGTFDLSTLLGFYMTNKGWKGKRIYSSSHGAKVGSEGFLQTPLFDVSNEGVTVSVSVSATDAERGKIRLALCDADGSVLVLLPVEAANGGSVRVNFGDVPNGKYCVRIEGDVSFYVESLSVYDGSYENSDFELGSIGSSMIALDRRRSVVADGGELCSFGELKGKRYRYRIKAMKDEASSQWTDYATVKLRKINSGITHMSDVEKEVRYYGINGMRLTQQNAEVGRGVVVVVEGGKNRKVVIR